MVITSDYILEKKNGLYYVRSNEQHRCPGCQGGMGKLGRKRRKVKQADGTWMTLFVRRFNCIPCNRIHHELPDIIVPYKRHKAASIEAVINDAEDEIPLEMDISTMNRLQNW